MYALLVPTMAIAAYGVYRRVRSMAAWSVGKSLRPTGTTLAHVAKYALLQLAAWRNFTPASCTP